MNATDITSNIFGVDQETTFVYVIIRRDLSFEQQLVQTNHATVEASSLYVGKVKNAHLVLLETRDESSLLEASNLLDLAGVKHVTFFEPDNDVGYSALATEPLKGDRRKPLRRFKLFKLRAK